tara:strand:+ start:10867 stop:11025 length:159 start_codon:yes stop_codon:yes gene_type:complete
MYKILGQVNKINVQITILLKKSKLFKFALNFIRKIAALFAIHINGRDLLSVL